MNPRKQAYLDGLKAENADFMAKNKVLITYPRDWNNKKVGVIVAFVIHDTIQIGWSRCNTTGNPVNHTHGDTFNKTIGLHRALFQAEPYNAMSTYPWSFEEDIHYMIDRARVYFKQAKAE